MCVLQIIPLNTKGPAAHKAAWCPTDSAVQRVRAKVHTATSGQKRCTGLMTHVLKQRRVAVDRKSIVDAAMQMMDAVARFVERARAFFYRVQLSGHTCPRCDGSLAMASEGTCKCRSCGREFDPTLAFQGCSSCGGTSRLRIRRYECGRCRSQVVSRFLFDGLVFDADYFRQKMVESRQRKREQRERVRLMLTESRSGVVDPAAIDLGAVPGLTEALDELSAETELSCIYEPRNGFDLRRYQAHVRAHVGAIPRTLEEIPPLGDRARIDRIWRFVAIIFLAHAGVVHAWQDGPTVMVMQCETNREGQDVLGDLEGTDGVEGLVG